MSTANIPAPKSTARSEKPHHPRQALQGAKPTNGSERHHAGHLQSNAALTATIAAALADHPYFRRRSLTVRADGGHVTLHGVVATYYHKQVAQEMIRKFDGVHSVENLLDVTW